MNTHIYAEVFKFRGDDPYEKRDNETRFGSNRAVQAFRSDLAKGKVCWTGEFWQDWNYYLACEHPLISIFKAPRVHPFSPKERIVVLAITSALAGVVSIFTKLIADALQTGDTWIDIILPQAIPIAGGIALTFIGTFLRLFATCGCVQNTRPTIRDFCEQLGAYLLGISVFITSIIAGIGIYITYKDGVLIPFLISFGTSMISSWISAFIKLYIAFRWFWKSEYNIDMNKMSFIVSYHDYQDVIAMRRLRRTNYPGLSAFEERRNQTIASGETQEERRNSRRRSSYVPKNIIQVMSPRTIKDLEVARIQQSCVLEISENVIKNEIEASPYDKNELIAIRNNSIVKAKPVFDTMMQEIEKYEENMIEKGYDQGGLLVAKDKRDKSKRRQSLISVSLGRANTAILNELNLNEMNENDIDDDDSQMDKISEEEEQEEENNVPMRPQMQLQAQQPVPQVLFVQQPGNGNLANQQPAAVQYVIKQVSPQEQQQVQPAIGPLTLHLGTVNANMKRPMTADSSNVNQNKTPVKMVFITPRN